MLDDMPALIPKPVGADTGVDEDRAVAAANEVATEEVLHLPLVGEHVGVLRPALGRGARVQQAGRPAHDRVEHGGDGEAAEGGDGHGFPVMRIGVRIGRQFGMQFGVRIDDGGADTCLG